MMERMYLARKGDEGPTVTLKVFSAGLSKGKDFAKNFGAEAKAGARLKHPAINRVLDVGRARGRVFCASEYAKGRSLRYLLEKQGRLKLGLALNLARQVAEALNYAHSQGLVHGDVKPSNVIMAPDTTIKVANFGIVENPLHNLLAVSKMSGSAPIYAAPELAVKGAKPTVKSDIYSLGAMLYHMIAGRPPFEGTSPVQMLMRVAEEELAPPSEQVKGLPEDVDAVVMAMLAVEPDERHADMAAVLEDLTDLGAEPAPKPAEPAETEPAPEPDDPETAERKAEERRKTMVGVAAVVAVGAFFLITAIVLLILAPSVPQLPEVKQLPAPPPAAPAD